MSPTGVALATRPASPAVPSEVLVPESDDREAPVERAGIEEFLRQCAAEQDRLRAEIDIARRRIARAGAAETHAVDDGLAKLVIESHEVLARIEQEHRQVLKAIHDGALTEASRLLEDARTRADEVRARADRLRQQPDAGGTT